MLGFVETRLKKRIVKFEHHHALPGLLDGHIDRQLEGFLGLFFLGHFDMRGPDAYANERFAVIIPRGSFRLFGQLGPDGEFKPPVGLEIGPSKQDHLDVRETSLVASTVKRDGAT